MDFGEALGRRARAGWVVGLTGDLGAGKTLLVKGLARGLGVIDHVHSPTFALVNEYAGGRLHLSHLDLYRLTNAVEVARLGLDDYLDRHGDVVVVEWFERWGSPPTDVLPRLHLVSLEVLSEHERRVTHAPPGA